MIKRKIGSIYVPYKIASLDDSYWGYESLSDALSNMQEVGEPGRQFIVEEDGIQQLYIYQGETIAPIKVGANTPVFTSTTNGLVPTPNETTSTKFLRGDGQWVVPPNTTYSAGTQALLTAGTDTSNRVWSSKILYDYINLKLTKPTTNATNEFVILGDGSTEAKSNFGKVDKVMGVSPDANKNVDISAVAMNWTNATQRMTALTDKSTDATYNRFMLMNSTGNINYSTQIANALESGLQGVSQEQALRLGQLFNAGQGSSGAISVNTISPPIIQNRFDSVEYVVLRGANLYLNTTSMKIEILANDRTTVITTIPNNQIINNSSTELMFYYNFYQYEEGVYFIRVTSGVKVYITTIDLRVVDMVEDINLNNISWSQTIADGVSIVNDIYNGASFLINSYSPATNNIVKSIKTSELFAVGDDFYIEINCQLNPHTSGGHDNIFSYIGLGYSSTNNLLSNNTLVYINFSWWGSGDGYRLENNSDKTNIYSSSSQTFLVTIKKTGNLFVTTLKTSVGVYTNTKTISNNSGYSLFLQMVGRPYQTILQGQIIKAFKF